MTGYSVCVVSYLFSASLCVRDLYLMDRVVQSSSFCSGTHPTSFPHSSVYSEMTLVENDKTSTSGGTSALTKACNASNCF